MSTFFRELKKNYDDGGFCVIIIIEYIRSVMKHFFKMLLVVNALFTIVLISNVFACTTIIVGKGASSDGSAFFGRSDDCSELSDVIFKSVPASNESGSFIYEDESTKLRVKLPKKMYQYFFAPEEGIISKGDWGEVGSNEMGVCMTATETIRANELALKYDPYVNNGVAESNIIRLIIPYVKTAREGVKRLGDMVEKYGSAESNAVVFSDNDEIWYMEIYTGHQEDFFLMIRKPNMM